MLFSTFIYERQASGESDEAFSVNSCKNLELRACCAYRNSKYMSGWGRRLIINIFFILVVKMMYGKITAFSRLAIGLGLKDSFKPAGFSQTSCFTPFLQISVINT